MTEYKVTVVWFDGASTKSSPNTGGTNFETIPMGEVFYIDAIVPDNLDPVNAQKLWGRKSRGTHIGKYVALWYPSSSRGNIRCTWEEVVVNPPPTEIYLTHIIEVYSDGSITIDGAPY